MAGAATGTAVAMTIGKGILASGAISFLTVIAGLASVIVWGTIATYYGLPVSITHGFVAGLTTAGVAAVGSEAIQWNVLQRVLSAVVTAPVLGFVGILSAAFMAYSHGKNDGQMPIGVITMALVIYYNQPALWNEIPYGDLWWVIVISALAISTGTAIGGWRVIRTLGMRVTTLQPVHGFAAEVSAATVIEVASHFGIPVSTTHCVSSSIMGVGATRRLSAVRWGIAGNIVAAWILTFPICGILGYLFAWLLGAIL